MKHIAKIIDNKLQVSDKILADINKVQARARERLIDIKDVNACVNFIDKHLNNIGVCKKNRAGITVSVNIHAQDFANSYRGVPESTHIYIEFNGKGLPMITKIYRCACKNKRISFTFTDEAKTDIIRKMSVI